VQGDLSAHPELAQQLHLRIGVFYVLCEACNNIKLQALDRIETVGKWLEIILLLRSYQRMCLEQKWESGKNRWPWQQAMNCRAPSAMQCLQKKVPLWPAYPQGLSTKLRQRTFFISWKLHCFTHQHFPNRKELEEMGFVGANGKCKSWARCKIDKWQKRKAWERILHLFYILQ